DCDAEFFGGLEVDDKRKLARLFDWQGGRLGALEKLVDINRGALVHILIARSVGHQASDLNGFLVGIYVRQPLLFGEIHYTLAIMQENAIRQNEERVWSLFSECSKSVVEVFIFLYVVQLQLYPHRLCGGASLSH